MLKNMRILMVNTAMRSIINKNLRDIISIMMKIVMIMIININMTSMIMNMKRIMSMKVMKIIMNMNMSTKNIMDMNTMKNMSMTIINMKNTITQKNMKTIIYIIMITTITKIYMVYFCTLQLTLWEALVTFIYNTTSLFYILGVIVSLVLIELFQWYIADAIASFVISLMISASIIPLIKSSAEILLQSYPKKYRKNVINLMENVKKIFKSKNIHGIDQ